jgi:hypothetical protein
MAALKLQYVTILLKKNVTILNGVWTWQLGKNQYTSPIGLAYAICTQNGFIQRKHMY